MGFVTTMERDSLEYGWTDLEFERSDVMAIDIRPDFIPLDEQLYTLSQRPSLLQLCMQQAGTNLSHYAHTLQFLPFEIATLLVQDFLGRFPVPSLRELEILCEAFWRPIKLRLSEVEGLDTNGMLHLPNVRNLVRLDFTKCSWLSNLSFLPGLKCLECLNLRDCWYLPGESLLLIQELPQLQCLDVENVHSFTDDLSQTLSENKCLGEELPLSSIEDLKDYTQVDTSVEDLKLVTQGGHYGVEALLRQWPISNLTYLRLQQTHITHAAVSHLLGPSVTAYSILHSHMQSLELEPCFFCCAAIPDLLFLNVRVTSVTGKAIFALQAKHKLVAFPNNAKVAARTNSMLAGVLGGECGCSAMARPTKSFMTDLVSDKLMVPWELAAVQLLQKATLDYYGF